MLIQTTEFNKEPIIQKLQKVFSCCPISSVFICGPLLTWELYYNELWAVLGKTNKYKKGIPFNPLLRGLTTLHLDTLMYHLENTNIDIEIKHVLNNQFLRIVYQDLIIIVNRINPKEQKLHYSPKLRNLWGGANETLGVYIPHAKPNCPLQVASAYTTANTIAEGNNYFLEPLPMIFSSRTKLGELIVSDNYGILYPQFDYTGGYDLLDVLERTIKYPVYKHTLQECYKVLKKRKDINDFSYIKTLVEEANATDAAAV